MDTSSCVIDLAKNVFQVAILRDNKIISNQRFSRTKLKEFLCNSAPTSIFMEACYSTHYWARFAQYANHDVGLIPAQHVSPFTRANKSDANDAIATYSLYIAFVSAWFAIVLE